MLLDLSRLRGGVEHVERRFDPASFALGDEEFRVTAPATLVADLHKDGLKVRLTGRLEASLECVCSRCVEPFPVPVNATLDLLCLPAPEGRGEGEHEVAEDDLGVSYYQDDVIDLGELMREQFYLALPMKPLCRADCKGLCPTCGINRNRETCSCKAVWVDPRLEVLKSLKREESR